jgi:hypothetical protein
MSDACNVSCVSLCLCRFPKDTQPGLVRAKDPAKKLIALGIDFKPMEKIIEDSMESLKNKGYIS